MFQPYLLVGLGGALGSMLRYGISTLLPSKDSTSFPYGTFVVNIVGCLIFGLLIGYFQKTGLTSNNVRFFLTTGFCGGFTTFSAFSGETLTLVQNQQFTIAAVYVLASLILGLTILYLGTLLIK